MLSQEEILKIEQKISTLKIHEKCLSPKVSIVVPVYNTEKYVWRCLWSLVNQTLQDIEIIAVNDGSTDDTPQILKLFAQKDNRIMIVNQENQRQGVARNKGIELSIGEYIGFIDSDDWIDLDFFEKLYTAAKKYNSDIALATNVRTGNGKNKKRISINEEKFVTDLQSKVDICNLKKDGCPTNKIYRASLLRKFGIKYPVGVYCEDKIFTTKSVFYANGIAAVPGIYYYYYRNPHSTVNTYKKHDFRDHARAEVLKFLKEHNAQIRDKDFWAIKKQYNFLGLTLYTVKESLHTEKHFLFSFIPLFEKSV